MDTPAMEVPQGAAVTDLQGREALSVHDVFVRVGMLTRNLHDTLRELGYDDERIAELRAAEVI